MKRKHYDSVFKGKIALELVKGLRTVNEIASDYEVHPTMIMGIFARTRKKSKTVFYIANKSYVINKKVEKDFIFIINNHFTIPFHELLYLIKTSVFIINHNHLQNIKLLAGLFAGSCKNTLLAGLGAKSHII